MKFLKSILVLFMSVIVMSASSQTVSANAYLGTNSTHLLGGDLFVTLKNGMVFGVGGSHAIETFFTSNMKDGNDFSNKNYNIAPMPPGYTLFDSFVENRGTVSGLFGYSFKSNTAVMGDLGISFNQTINLFTSSPNSSNSYSNGSLGYKTIGSSQFLYGMTVTQNFGGRFGIMLGYNNIQSLKFGLSYKITPTKMFKY